MLKKMTSADREKNTSRIFFKLIVLFCFLTLALLISCRTDEAGSEYKKSHLSDGEEENLYLFDYEKIEIEDTSSIGLKIQSTNLYLDVYQDLVVMGELRNVSAVNKTDVEITLDFYDKYKNEVISASLQAPVNYLRGGSTLPFCYYVAEKDRYIDISSLKIGVNYKDYHENFKGNPIVEIESHSYTGDFMVIEGRVINLGNGEIGSLMLFCTFYDSKDRVVFIKQCSLSSEKMEGRQEQGFVLKVLLDEYLPDFTHYGFEIFFEDEIALPV